MLSSVGFQKPASDPVAADPTLNSNKRKLSGAWSFMSPPTKSDITGGRKLSKAFDAPKPTFDYLVVLDFEWTCDDKKFGPSEIIEFPSVLLSGVYLMRDQTFCNQPDNDSCIILTSLCRI